MAVVSEHHLAAWNRLVGEVQAGRIDSPAARDASRRLGMLGLLVSAWAHAQRRELTAARAELDRALHSAEDSAIVLLIAGMITSSLREPRAAMARLRAAARSDPRTAQRALDFELQISSRMCWSRDTCEVAERALGQAPRLSGRAHATLSQLYAEAELFDLALREAEATLPACPSVERRLEHAHLAARAWRVDLAVQMVEGALQQAGACTDVQLAAAEILLTIGAFERAEAVLRQVTERAAADSRAWSRLAELRCWQRDDAAAETLAKRALDTDPACVAALRVRGICALQRARAHEALEWFDQALALSPVDAETRVWRARARLLLNQPTQAVRDLDKALQLNENFYLAAELVKAQHQTAQFDPVEHRAKGPVRSVNPVARAVPAEKSPTPTGLPRKLVEPTIAFLRLLHPEAGAVLTSEDGAAQHAILSEGLALLGTNYSRLTTLHRDGRLERVPATSIRQEALRALETIRVLSIAEVRARLDEVIARHPESSLPLCYMGELYVWLGEVDEARRWLHRAIEHTINTRWAYIGLSACELVRGEYEQALAVLALGIERMSNTTGPAVYPHRAEALRRLGRFAAARADLERAMETSPRRLSTWINLGLLDAEVGDEPALARAFEHMRRRAAGLVADAAEEIGAAAWVDGDALPSAPVQRQLLEQMLVMMRGNRAAGLVTYFRAGGSLHMLIPVDIDLAQFDQSDLEISWSLIERLSPARRRG